MKVLLEICLQEAFPWTHKSIHHPTARDSTTHLSIPHQTNPSQLIFPHNTPHSQQPRIRPFGLEPTMKKFPRKCSFSQKNVIYPENARAGRSINTRTACGTSIVLGRRDALGRRWCGAVAELWMKYLKIPEACESYNYKRYIYNTLRKVTFKIKWN